MNLAEIIEEMRRRPDAHLLVEWIDDHSMEYSPAEVRTVIAAYYAALEDR